MILINLLSLKNNIYDTWDLHLPQTHAEKTINTAKSCKILNKTLFN